jgi:hypothetical protein
LIQKSVHLKLKNNIRKLLISLTLGIVFIGSFLSNPVHRVNAAPECVNGIKAEGGTLLINKNPLYPDEKFQVYASFPSLEECKDQASNIKFTLVIEEFKSSVIGLGSVDFNAVPLLEGETFKGFQGGIETTYSAVTSGSKLITEGQADLRYHVNITYNGESERTKRNYRRSTKTIAIVTMGSNRSCGDRTRGN